MPRRNGLPGPERAKLRDSPLRRWRLQQVLCDEGARAGAEAWARPRARADVPQALDRRCVTGAARERPPEKVLVERERAPGRVAVPKVHVQPLEIGGRKHGAAEQARLEIRDVPSESRLDTV